MRNGRRSLVRLHVGPPFKPLGQALLKLELKMQATISKAEFARILNRPDIVGTFLEAGIDVVALLRDPDIVFAGDSDMSLDEFLEALSETNCSL